MPDADALAALFAAVADTAFADVRWVVETGSTNADVLELARGGEPEGIVVVADHQTAGRGRRGRTWEAPPEASLMATVLLRPRAEVAGLTTMGVAVALSEAVEACCGLSPRLKWPNDLVWPGAPDGDATGDVDATSRASASDRKLAGILAEADWPAASHIAGGWSPPTPDQRVVVAVGFGLNVAWAGRTPPDLAGVAVALDELTAPEPPPERTDLLAATLVRLDGHYRSLQAEPSGADRLRAAWKARSATLGRRVRVDLGSEDLEGTAVDVTNDGHLVVETLEGDRRTLAVGDVVHLQPGRPR